MSADRVVGPHPRHAIAPVHDRLAHSQQMTATEPGEKGEMTMKTQPERMMGRYRAPVLALLGLAVTAPLADAQTAGALDGLQGVLNRGDRVTVRDGGGRDLTGRLVELSSWSLALDVGGARRELYDFQVASVHQWRPDPLRNGALIGLLVGALPSTFITMSLYIYGKNHGGSALYGGLIGAGLSFGTSAGLGAGVDALLDTPYLVYGNTRRTRRSVSVSPLMSEGNRGVALSLGF